MKKQKRARKIRVQKAVKVSPDKVLLEVEVEGVIDLPSDPPPQEPLDLQAKDHPPVVKTWLDWIAGLW